MATLRKKSPFVSSDNKLKLIFLLFLGRISVFLKISVLIQTPFLNNFHSR